METPMRDPLGRVSPYVRWQFDEIIVRGKSTHPERPLHGIPGDIWYDNDTHKTWVYTQDLIWVNVPF
jgi:hypothetical protein